MGNTAFDNETYLQSLAASGADLDRQIQNALNEVNRQRDVAFGQADQIAGRTGSVLEGFQNQARTADQGLQGSITSLLPPGMFGGHQFLLPDQAFHDAVGANRAAFGRAGGLVRQGFDEQARGRTSQVQNIGSSIRTDLQRQRDDYIARREAEDRDLWHRTVEANRQRALQEQALAQQASLAQQQLAHQAQLAAGGRSWEQWMAETQRQHLAMLGSPPPAPLIPSQIKPTEHMNISNPKTTTPVRRGSGGIYRS